MKFATPVLTSFVAALLSWAVRFVMPGAWRGDGSVFALSSLAAIGLAVVGWFALDALGRGTARDRSAEGGAAVAFSCSLLFSSLVIISAGHVPGVLAVIVVLVLARRGNFFLWGILHSGEALPVSRWGGWEWGQWGGGALVVAGCWTVAFARWLWPLFEAH